LQVSRSSTCAVLVIAVTTSAVGAYDEPAENRSLAAALVLDVSLVVAAGLPEPSRAALMLEAERIWAAAGVEVRWVLSPPTAPPPDVGLRALVISRPPRTPEDDRWAIGELLPLTDDRAIAVASITGARRVLDEARHQRWSDLAISDDRRLGIVLGRAVAHEIGHFVLDTRTHAPWGLMRERFGASEFADSRAGATFALDSVARGWLHQALARAATRRPSVGEAKVWRPFTGFSLERFTYRGR
jgi:hypothetical protein